MAFYISFNKSVDIVFFLSVHLPEHDVQGADDGHDVGQHVVLAHQVQTGQVGKPGGLDLAPAKTNQRLEII